MKKIIAILMCLLCFGFMVACQKSDPIKEGYYVVKGQEDLKDPVKELNKTTISIKKDKFFILVNPLHDRGFSGKYEVKDGKVYVEDKDNNKFVFKVSGNNLIFEEGEMLEKFEKKGTEFVIINKSE
ncbi:hypothetical protein SAMN02745248_00930 [Hathewaya proteolytica DSM 3090]|uniref:Lipoprotein n=1 Tax=Hathewaya proteolytica DSM 3090 TaxID=1121331 RepID=A0A1M6M3A2_9CLOT|nr:hypothetical protein [Hathewaya proteolytica]SHJ77944.1 hypothetical protein SAMN02745248_00930 [Hathewaya proteolytica DSM 3090]